MLTMEVQGNGLLTALASDLVNVSTVLRTILFPIQTKKIPSSLSGFSFLANIVIINEPLVWEIPMSELEYMEGGIETALFSCSTSLFLL